jgi:hypothetical protein
MIYESIIKRLLLESKLDSLAGKVSRIAMSKLASSSEKINNLPRTKEGNFIVRIAKFLIKIRNDIAPQTSEKISLSMIVKILHTKDDKAVTEASWDWKVNELNILITVQSTTGKIMPIHLGMIQPYLHNAIRHELEHSSQGPELAVSSIQTGYEMMQDKKDIEKKKKYYTDPSEIPAFIAGARQQSKKQKRSFYEIIDEMLRKIEKSFINHGINDQLMIDDAIKDIKNAWILYAEKNFPSVTRKFFKNRN